VIKMIDTAYLQHLNRKCPFCGAFGEKKGDYKKCPVCNAKFNEYLVLDEGKEVILNNN